METVTQRDYLRENADNVWFVLGAYFFTFFPWAILNNIDFISEKWRTCSRTRQLGRRHLASYVIPIIYVAVYAEAQRRDGDNKELGAALAALMFNLFQVLRTIMGWVQLNAFVAWCKDAVECIRALDGDVYESSSSSSESARSTEGVRDKTRRMMRVVGRWQKVFVLWCRRESRRMRALRRRDREKAVQHKNGGSENRESSVNMNVGGNEADGAGEHLGPPPRTSGENRNAESNADANSNVDEDGQSVERAAEGSDSENESDAESTASHTEAEDWNWIEDKIMVNNMVVDNELGGRDVSVSLSSVKIWRELKNGRFTPSKWLRTDRVILNTVRWGGAYLCGMGKGWSVDRYHDSKGSKSGEILESFFSKEMYRVRSILQQVEWVVNVENGDSEFLAINATGSFDVVELAGEMSTAYGEPLTSYNVEDTYTVDAYSFEFNSLVGSYPSGGKMFRIANRERVGVGLVHSVLLAKHLGIENLRQIRRYYDQYRLPEGACLRNAFELLVKQTDSRISDDAKIWRMFDSNEYDIPLFPYRMQMVALWDEATNWRVLQTSARCDNTSSLGIAEYFELENEHEKCVLRNAPQPVNIFDYCAKWTTEQNDESDHEDKGSLGVVMETVRTFLAEWVTASAQKANWETEIPTASVEFKKGLIPDFFREKYLTWICQRELQRKVAKIPREAEDFTGNAALLMLFVLGFPLLKMDYVLESDTGSRNSQDSADKARGSSSSNPYQTLDMNIEVWRSSTPLAPQQISVIIRCDFDTDTVSLRLQNDSGDARFIWQDWVDAAMGCMQGFEEGKNGKWGYGRKIVRPNLQKPIVEMCPLRVYGYGIEKRVVRTGTARMWMGWPVFDVHICKFEIEQWLEACDVDIRRDIMTDRELASIESVINVMISECS